MATKHLSKNMGGFDRAVRGFVVAPIAIATALALGASSIGGLALLAVAGFLLATSASGYCPPYALVGIDTRGRTPLPRRP